MLTALLLALAAEPQCCLGATNTEAAAPGGRYTAKAESLTGIGIHAHGPYRYRFTGAAARPIDFELAWDNTKHFWMGLHVSPTGNGFLLETSLQDALVAYGPDGSELWRITPAEGETWLHLDTISDDGLFLDVQAYADVEGDRWVARQARVFLPLGLAVGQELHRPPRRHAPWEAVPAQDRRFPVDLARQDWLARAVRWSEAQGQREAAQVEGLLGQLEGTEDPAPIVARLVELGSSTRLVLAERELSEAAVAVEDGLRRASAGHRWPHRDLDLLLALLAFPEGELATVAWERLSAILPEGTDVDEAQIRARRDAWRWDSALDRYVEKAR